jgi:hypothetical protein
LATKGFFEKCQKHRAATPFLNGVLWQNHFHEWFELAKPTPTPVVLKNRRRSTDPD